MKKRLITVVSLSVFPACAAFGQPATAPQFEVASIKPSNDGPGSSGISTNNGRLSGRNVTLKRCVRSAYGVQEAQILGGPKWLDEDRYYIEAKASGPAGDRELSIMLQSLLAERFQLALHRETRTLPGLALVVGKGGLKAKPSATSSSSRTNSSRGIIQAERCSMTQLALKVSEVLRLPVADMTNVQGDFDFKLEWTPDDGDKSIAASGPSIYAALQEQLGLKLQSRKVPVEVLVIDHAEKPSEN